MRKIVLCMDNGNPYLEETKKYLSSRGCKVFSTFEEGRDIRTLLEEIDQREGRLDILLLGVC